MHDISEKYVPTIHWATTKDGFDSIVTLFNYYGYAFHKNQKEQTDADVVLNFFDEEGNELQEYKTAIETGRTLHIPVSNLHKNFSGVVAATMHPKGDMHRLSWKNGNQHKPIATSYFMLYEKEGGYKDFSHELFAARKKPDSKIIEWATVLYVNREIRSGFIVMNNRLYSKSADAGSSVTAQIFDMNSNSLSDIFTFSINPGGSRLLMLEEAFAGVDFNDQKHVTVIIRGNNIEQPMSMHKHTSGDFNIHHF